jgi:hypothetical protein
MIVLTKRRLLPGPALMALAAVLAAVSLTACSRGVSLDGPLGPPGSGVTVCVSVKPGHLVTDGVDVVTNKGNQTLVIESLSLRSPRKMRMTGALIVPLHGGGGIGLWAGFPPPTRQLLRSTTDVEWAKRRPPRGVRVLPGHEIGLAVGVTPTTTQQGSAAGTRVRYEVSGRQYELDTVTRIILKVAPAKCF